MAEQKVLRPPFVWQAKDGLVEDSRYQRWTAAQVKAMKAGTYDWSQHQERTS